MNELNTDKKKKIFKQFLYNKKLSFGQIEKLTGLRSNDLAYYIQKFVRTGIIEKKKQEYTLSKEYEKYIHLFGEHLTPLVVILIACTKNKRILLLKREKRPYKNYWGLIGGRIRMEESITTASKRILKEKTYLEGTIEKTNSITLEHVKEEKESEIKHSYILILVTMKPTTIIKEKENIKWFNTKKIPKRTTIPSDAWLIQNKLHEKIYITEEEVTETGERLTMKIG